MHSLFVLAHYFAHLQAGMCLGALALLGPSGKNVLIHLNLLGGFFGGKEDDNKLNMKVE